MSENLTKVSIFLRYILQASKVQAKYLLKNLTPDETKALCEIAYNLPSIKLTPQQSKLYKQNSFLIKKLAQKRLKLTTKATFIGKRYLSFYKLLLSLKDIILTLLE